MAKLHFKYGAMNAGKSTILLQTAHNYEERNQKVLVLKPEIDTKGKDTIESRLKISRKVDFLISETFDFLTESFIELIRDYNCIIIDEAQFLQPNQVEQLWIITKQYNIPVICYGLKSNYKTHLFNGSTRLLELADELVELPTICYCGKKARFNALKLNGVFISEGETDVVIDNDQNVEYVSLCGKCYQNTLMKEKIKIRKG